MKSAQSMTVSRHVQSVRSVHRRRNPPQERLRNWQVRQHDTATRRASSALHSHLPSPPSFRRGPLSSLGMLPPHPHHCALQPSRERETENLHALVHPQRRISLCISSRRATCETCVPHETLYLTAFVSPMSEKRSRPFTYLLPRFDTTRVSVDSFLPSFLHSFFFLEKLLRRLFNFGRFGEKSCVLCIPLTKG